jgi:hypothetical protein
MHRHNFAKQCSPQLVLGEAFDAACKEVHGKGQPAIVYEVIVKRIVDAVKNCERDPVQLRNVGLAGLGFEANTQSKGRPQLLEHRGVAQPHTHGHAAHLGPLALVNFVHPSA